VKKAVIWSPQARQDLRRMDRRTATKVLKVVDRYVGAGAGAI